MHPSQHYDDKVRSRAHDDEALKVRSQERQEALLARRAARSKESGSIDFAKLLRVADGPLVAESGRRAVSDPKGPAKPEQQLDDEADMLPGDLHPSADYARKTAERDFSDDGIARRAELIQKAAERRRNMLEPMDAADSLSLEEPAQILERCLQREEQSEDGNAKETEQIPEGCRSAPEEEPTQREEQSEDGNATETEQIPEGCSSTPEPLQEACHQSDLQTWPSLEEVIAATRGNTCCVEHLQPPSDEFFDRFYEEAQWVFDTSSEAAQRIFLTDSLPPPMPSTQGCYAGLPAFPGSGAWHSSETQMESQHLGAYHRDLTFEEALGWGEQATPSQPAMCVEAQQQEMMKAAARETMHARQPLPAGRVHKHQPWSDCLTQGIFALSSQNALCSHENKFYADGISPSLSSGTIIRSAARNSLHRKPRIVVDSSSHNSRREKTVSSKASGKPLHLRNSEHYHIIEQVLRRRPELEAGKKVVASVSEWLPGALEHCDVNRAMRHTSKHLPGLAWSFDLDKSEIQVHLADIACFSRACDGL